jgi:aspartate aminotransferase
VSGRLPPRLASLLAAQESFETARKTALGRHGRALCDFSYANAHDGPPEGAREALLEATRSPYPSDFQYTPYGGATIARRLVAQRLTRTHDVRFDLRDIVLVPGAMAGLNLLFRSLRDHTEGAARDEALVITPCWLDYPLYLENHGYDVRYAPLTRRELRLDYDAIEAQLTSRTRLVILSQPSNPTGLVYSASELEKLAAILERSASRPVLISDECHRDFVFGPLEAPSAVRFYPETCVVYSFGKKLFMQGQRVGFIAVSPKMQGGAEYREDLERWARITGFCTPTAVMQRALGALLELTPELELIQKRSVRLRKGLLEAGYHVPEPQGTFFLYPEVPGDDTEFCARLAESGVLALPAKIFHDTGHVRLSVTAPDDAIDRAIPIFSRVLAESRR